MTLIAAVVMDGVGYMVADSRITENNGRHYPAREGKAWRAGDMLIGWTGYLRTAQALRYGLTIPPYEDGKDAFAYLCGPFVDAVRECVKNAGAGCAPKNNGSEQLDTEFLIVWQGRIFVLGTDLSICEYVETFAVGSGSSSALGTIRALWKADPKTRLLTAARIASENQHDVGAPYTLLRTDTPDAPPEVHI